MGLDIDRGIGIDMTAPAGIVDQGVIDAVGIAGARMIRQQHRIGGREIVTGKTADSPGGIMGKVRGGLCGKDSQKKENRR